MSHMSGRFGSSHPGAVECDVLGTQLGMPFSSKLGTPRSVTPGPPKHVLGDRATIYLGVTLYYTSGESSWAVGEGKGKNRSPPSFRPIINPKLQ